MKQNVQLRCRAEAYRGRQPYIFISYCHDDGSRVYPLIERLERDGFRVWYDEGITPGDEWSETIATHLEGCSVFVAAITEASVNSHNCRNEINFAVQRNKDFVSLFLDDVKLSQGMELLLSSVQGIFRSKYRSEEDYIQKLYEMESLQRCRDQEQAIAPAMADFIDEDETVTLTQGIPGLQLGSLETFLLRVKTQEKIHISRNEFTIGRSSMQADYVLEGEYSISRRHATIRKMRGNYTITDNNSLNHVGLNGRLIVPGTEYDIGAYDIISLAKEHLVFFKNYNEAARRVSGYELRDGQGVWKLGTKPVTRVGSQLLGPDGSGNEICLADPGVCPQQAFLVAATEGLYIVDISENRTTSVNGRQLPFCTKIRLQAGDRIDFAGRTMQFDIRL